MDDVISLGIGEPDFDTPERIVAAGVRSLHNGRTHYTSNYGTIELRRALAEHLINGTPLVEGWLETPTEVVTAENVEDYVSRQGPEPQHA